MTLTFDGHVLDVERRELRRGAVLIKLEPQVFDLLTYLVRHRDRVIGKDELIEAVWCGRIVSDAAVTTRINAVRRAVRDNGIEQRLIRTLRRKGFRFIGQVSEAAATQQSPEPEAVSSAEGSVLGPAFAEGSSVAVFPFFVIGGGARERAFADGLAEDVVMALSRFRWLRVVAPMSWLACQDKKFDAKRMGREARVRYFVQGAVRRGGQRMRVTARLIELVTGSLLWSDCFDGLVEDGFELQERVASTIAGSIEPILQLAEAHWYGASSSRGVTPHGLRFQAHPIFSSGREPVLRSLRLLEQAIELDPNYGAALADAANCRQILDVNGWAADRQLNRRQAVDVARMAVQVASDPEPVAIAAFVLAYFGEDIDAAVALMENALRLNPSFAKGWYMSGMTRLYAGQPEQAIECFETSIRLNPRDRVGRRNIAGIGIAYLFSYRFDEAVPILRPVIQEFPRWATPYCALASCHAHLGFLRESEVVARRLRAVDASPVPNAAQFRDARHRELLSPALTLIGSRPPVTR